MSGIDTLPGQMQQTFDLVPIKTLCCHIPGLKFLKEPDMPDPVSSQLLKGMKLHE